LFIFATLADPVAYLNPWGLIMVQVLCLVRTKLVLEALNSFFIACYCSGIILVVIIDCFRNLLYYRHPRIFYKVSTNLTYLPSLLTFLAFLLPFLAFLAFLTSSLGVA
jgi:hypothetical protein